MDHCPADCAEASAVIDIECVPAWCLRQLAERDANDRERGWFWKLKAYKIRCELGPQRLEQIEAASLKDPGMTERESRFTAETHPWLADDEMNPAAQTAASHWQAHLEWSGFVERAFGWIASDMHALAAILAPLAQRVEQDERHRATWKRRLVMARNALHRFETEPDGGILLLRPADEAAAERMIAGHPLLEPPHVRKLESSSAEDHEWFAGLAAKIEGFRRARAEWGAPVQPSLPFLRRRAASAGAQSR